MIALIKNITLPFLVFFILPAMSANDDSVRFPVVNWSKELLLTIDKGPSILGRELNVHVPPPPNNTSARTQYELETLRAYKLERTKTTRQKIYIENTEEPISNRFADVINISSKTTPKTIKLLEIVISETGYFVLREKKRFQRPRPSQLANDLELVIPNPPHAAYPSGHATQHYAAALILGMLNPVKKDVYIKKAFDVARRREIAGVHYPSDSMAGFKLAETVVSELMKKQQFLRAYEKARTELGISR